MFSNLQCGNFGRQSAIARSRSDQKPKSWNRVLTAGAAGRDTELLTDQYGSLCGSKTGQAIWFVPFYMVSSMRLAQRLQLVLCLIFIWLPCFFDCMAPCQGHVIDHLIILLELKILEIWVREHTH